MKKNIILLLTLLAPLFMRAQIGTASSAPDIPLDDKGKIRYVEVAKQEGAQKDLFKRCVKWINSEYKNPSSVTPTRDMVNGKIVIRHTFRIYNAAENGVKTKGGEVLYDFIIRFKDNRYRMEMTNFIVKKTSRTPAEKWLDKSSKDYNPAYAKQLDEFAHMKMESLKQGMKPEKEYKEEEW